MRPTLTPALLALCLTLTLPVAMTLAGSARGQTAEAASETGSAEAVAMAEGDAMAESTAEAGSETLADAAPEMPEIPPGHPTAPLNAADVTLTDFQWLARPIIVFADTPADPRLIEQLELLAARPEPLLERDVVVIVDTDPSARSEIRTALRPRGFSLVLMQKDGNVGVRRPSPRDVREIMRTIDNFQLRQEEVRRGG